MKQEQVMWNLLGVKLISFRKQLDGYIVGTGLLNPLIEKLGLFTTIYFQARFYKQYENLARKNGKRVSNVFAPPTGSRAQFRALWSLVKSRLLMRPFPTAVTFAVTYRCQANCPHCSAGRHIRKDIQELSTDEAKQIVDETTDLGVSVLAFTGGEPLVRKDIYELISHVDKRKTIAHLFTNGLLLTDENVKRLVDAGLYTLFLSLDSHIPEEHDRLRGIPGLFDNVPTGSLLKNMSEVLTMDHREEIIDYTIDIFKRRQIPPLTSQAWQNSVQGYLGGIGCVACCIQYYVSAYGDIAPCNFTPLSFGNLRGEPVKKIWKRIIRHPAYRYRSQFCRMQNPRFRHFYIDPIPDGATRPYDIAKLPREDYRKRRILEEAFSRETVAAGTTPAEKGPTGRRPGLYPGEKRTAGRHPAGVR